MSKSVVRVALCIVAVLAVPLQGQRPISGAAVLQRQVPVELSEMARAGTVGDFARALARSEVVAGFVAVRGDSRPTSTLSQRLQRQTPGVTKLADVVESFRSTHSAYLVEEGPGYGLFVAPASTPCRGALLRPISNVKLNGPVYAVGFQLLRVVNPSIPNIPPGIMAGGAAEVPPALFQQVSIIHERLTLHEALDEMVRQVPGLVWVLVQDVDRRDRRPSCVLNWFTSTGTSVTTYDFLQLRSR